MRSRLSGLRSELGQPLEDADKRWHALRSRNRAIPIRRKCRKNLVITPGPAGSHMVFIDWDNALRATSYGVLIKRNVVKEHHRDRERSHRLGAKRQRRRNSPTAPVNATVR